MVLMQFADASDPGIKLWDFTTGDYITGDVDEAYLTRLEDLRKDEKRSTSQVANADNAIIDLHNDED